MLEWSKKTKKTPRSWQKIWDKSLSPLRVMCLRFSTTNKCKQSAHIRDNQNILKATQNCAKASLTCLGRACAGLLPETLSAQLREEGAEQAMAHEEEFKLFFSDKTAWKCPGSCLLFFFKCNPELFPLPTPQTTLLICWGDQLLTRCVLT